MTPIKELPIEFIAQQPFCSDVTVNLDVRMRTVRVYPYRFFYSVTGNAIGLLHIRHTVRESGASCKRGQV
jgi:hypothetical protein